MQGRIVFLNDKLPLRDAGEENLKKRVARFAAQVRAKAAREKASVAAVFVHEDLDEARAPAKSVFYRGVSFRDSIADRICTGRMVFPWADAG